MFTLKNYTRYSNVSEVHFVHDFGTDDVDDVVYQADHSPMKVDVSEYPYTVYHLTFASLGHSILNSLDVSRRNYCPGVSNPTGLVVRSVPFSINLLSSPADSAIPNADRLPLPNLNWQF